LENRRLLSWQAILGDGGYSNVGASANDAAVAKDDTTTYLLTDEWGGVAHDANKSGTPDDDRLCWAAATSNTLAWTGWGNVSATGSSETDLFQYYKEHWENATGRPIHALNWWFDGVDRTLDWATWGHVFEPGGRFFPGVEFASYTNRVDYGDAGSADALPTVASYLGEGKAVMLYLHGPSSNHWLTCWGYDYRESDTDYYTGVWLTDSDDGQDGLVRYDVELDSDHWQIAQTADSYAGWPIGYVDVLSSRPSEIKEVPQSPANVSASTDLAAEILVSWDSAARADEYRLYRNTLDDFSTATAIATDLTSTSLSDATSLPGTTYHYWVIAANSGGESLPSLAATGIRPSAGINVSRVSGDTTEGGGTAAFTVTLTSQPSADVTIPLSSSDPTEGTVPASVTITPAQWQTGVVVTVTGVNDAADDGNTAYTIVTGDPASADASYDAFLADDVGDVAVTNADNDLSAHAGGPYSDDLGSQIALDASGSFNVGGAITSYAWDLDDDGQFDDADSVTAFFNATAKGRFTIRVQVTDDDGAAGVAAATVTVDNDTVGLYDPATGTFYLRNHNDAGNAEWTFNYGPGNLGWLPLAGDWNGDGIETVGLYNPATSTFYLKNTNSGGAADVTFRYGIAWLRWQPLVGDWKGDGVDTIGLYDPATGLFLLKNANSAGGADATFGYGPGGLGWQPLVGDWDGNGTDTVGVYDPAAAVFYLRNSNTSGVSDIGFAYGPPGSGWLPMAGNWDATGADTIRLYNAACAAKMGLSPSGGTRH
jgi:fibronectin type 3 domain-containing protein